jgi:hypothetical protein
MIYHIVIEADFCAQFKGVGDQPRLTVGGWKSLNDTGQRIPTDKRTTAIRLSVAIRCSAFSKDIDVGL